jgi:hypothetical protein
MENILVMANAKHAILHAKLAPMGQLAQSVQTINT